MNFFLFILTYILSDTYTKLIIPKTFLTPSRNNYQMFMNIVWSKLKIKEPILFINLSLFIFFTTNSTIHLTSTTPYTYNYKATKEQKKNSFLMETQNSSQLYMQQFYTVPSSTQHLYPSSV